MEGKRGGGEGAMEERVGEKLALSPAMKRLADYLDRTDKRTLLSLSVTELSEAAGVSEATVLRLCRLMGFKGYSDFRLTLAHKGKTWLREEPKDFIYELEQKYFSALGACRNALGGAALNRAYGLILAAGKIYCFAGAENALAALWLKNRLLEMGVFAAKEEDVYFRNIVIPACGEGDLLITVGGGKEAARAAELARAHGMKILALGGGEHYADCRLSAEGGEEGLVSLFLAEILCTGLLRAFPERFERALARSACSVAENKL